MEREKEERGGRWGFGRVKDGHDKKNPTWNQLPAPRTSPFWIQQVAPIKLMGWLSCRQCLGAPGAPYFLLGSHKLVWGSLGAFDGML
jgi:hypothetical protein